MMNYVLGPLRFFAGVLISLGCAALEIVLLPLSYKNGKLFHAVARFWARSILLTCGVKARLRGIEKIDLARNYVYVSNHASMFDIPAVLATIPDQIRIVYKKELEVIPIFGWGLKWGSYIGIDRGRGPKAMRSLEEAIGTIRNGASVFLYAEGTRTRDGNLQPFKRGAFNIAVRAGIPVIPLTINGTFPILPKGSIVIRPHPVELVLDDPIPVTGEGKEEEIRLMEQVEAAMRRNYREQKFTDR